MDSSNKKGYSSPGDKKGKVWSENKQKRPNYTHKPSTFKNNAYNEEGGSTNAGYQKDGSSNYNKSKPPQTYKNYNDYQPEKGE